MPSANQRISEYVLDAKLGGGTFGEVWRARHHVWVDQLVAIKIPTDTQYVRALQREGVAIHGLRAGSSSMEASLSRSPSLSAARKRLKASWSVRCTDIPTS